MRQQGFNPKARWDRHIPETSQDAPPEELNEKIEVLAWFKNGRIQPQLFLWNQKEYPVKTINYNWQERRGREVISYFSVSTGPSIYQISFNNTSCSWQINKVIE